MDVRCIAARFEQREVQRVLASQKGTAGQAAAVTDDPKTLPVAFDVEVIWQADTCRDKIGHGNLPRLFQIINKRSSFQKISRLIFRTTHKDHIITV